MPASLTYASRRRALTLTWGATPKARMPATMTTMPMTTAERASAAGRASAAAKTPDQRAEAARKAARGAHRPAALARRIAAAWPTLDAAERAEVLAILADLT